VRVKFCEYAIEVVDDLLPLLGDGATQIGIFTKSFNGALERLASEPVCTLRYYEADALSGAIFVSADSSKGDAVRAVLQHLSVEPAATLAIGDSEADLSMFAVAGHAVAVANATAAVREAAEWIAPAQWESGVAAAIRRYM
jgi:phosphoserine phosphatase